jgi:hypothetical protein
MGFGGATTLKRKRLLVRKNSQVGGQRMGHVFSNPTVAFLLFGGTYVASRFLPFRKDPCRQLRWRQLIGSSTSDFAANQFFWGAGVYAIVLALLNVLGAADGISAVAVLAAGGGGAIAALVDRYYTQRPTGSDAATAGESAV